jgi:hypothetical protein
MDGRAWHGMQKGKQSKAKAIWAKNVLWSFKLVAKSN